MVEEEGVPLEKPPAGYYKEKKKEELPLRIRDKELTEEETLVIRTYYEMKMQGWPDVLTTCWVARLLGTSRSSAIRLCRERWIQAFFIGSAYKMPQEYLIDYLVSERYRRGEKKKKAQMEQERELEELLKSRQTAT